jgi:hypothetical protein
VRSICSAHGSDGGAPKTARQVVVHQPGGLHEGVDDRCSNEVEATLFQIPRDRIGEFGSCWEILSRSCPPFHRLAAHPRPDVCPRRRARCEPPTRPSTGCARSLGSRAGLQRRAVHSEPRPLDRIRRKPPDTPRAFSGSSATKVQPGHHRATAFRTSADRRGSERPTRRRGRPPEAGATLPKNSVLEDATGDS